MTTEESLPSEASGWQDKLLAILSSVWSDFTSLFRFTTDREAAVMPLLTQEENSLMRQNLRLQIEQAKLALLAREQGIYQASLQQTSTWVQQHFDKAGDASRAMLEELQTLSTVSVNPTLPNVHRGLDALDDYLSHDHVPSAMPEQKPEPVDSLVSEEQSS